ncbi:hypothetical protein D9M73_40830 [compost metagenome]
MRRHAHDGAVAVAHQHIVTDPHLDELAGQRMRDKQAGALALFLLRGQLGFGRATGFAVFDKSGDFRVGFCSVQRQWMFRRHRAKGHAHDGVGARGEDIHLPVADQLARGIPDVVRKGKTHAFALAYPVLLHQLDALGPAGQLVADAVEKFFGVVGDLQVVARDLAFFNHCARAPALAVNYLLVGQHGLVHRVPVHDLGLAVGNALFKHLQKQPLVPLVITRVAGGDFARPVNGQPHRLHLLFHVGDVVVGPLRRRHAVFHGCVFGRQAKGIPAHGHQHVVALHAQIAREHVVDGVVAHMAHVQLAAGVRQHGAGVILALGLLGVGPVFDAVGITGSPVGLRIALNVEVVVFFLHGEEKAENGALKRGNTGRQPHGCGKKGF